jgi:DNA polymerase bacteriophage-type
VKRAVVVDFETASACDLKVAGAWRYAEDPTTEILCLCWTQLWDLEPGLWVPDDEGLQLKALAKDADVLFIAHNAAFEKAIWRRIMVPIFGFTDIPNDRWHDTMAVCAEKAIPQKLETALHALGLPCEKDTAGSRLTIGLSKPHRKTGMLDRSPATLEKVYRYCDNDVEIERSLHKRVSWQEPKEREVWLLDQKINERGVKLDLDFIRASQRVVADAMRPMLARFKSMTGYAPTQPAKVIEWCADQGHRLPNMQKETLVNWLGSDIDGSEPDYDEWRATDLDPRVREVLTIRQITASSSVKKLARMDACVCSDGRVRGVLQYHGAGTGRWAGRLFQPQNFPRPTAWDTWADRPDPHTVVQAILTGDHEYVAAILGPPVEAVVSGLRHSIVAERGHHLLAGDFAGIEARVVLALAGQHDKCELLANGLDPYVDFAAEALGVPMADITKRIRQDVGKPGVLGCGFQMGAKKLSFKYKLSMEAAQTIVDGYRKNWAPLVPRVWYGLEDAAVQAVRTGRPHEAYGCRYAMEDGWLTVRLPSGRRLWYWDPRVIKKVMPWDDTDIRLAVTYRAYKQGHMITGDAYGGLFTENVVQALARDLMVHAMMLMEKNGFPVILTVHDEIISEVLKALADEAAYRQIMQERPLWAVHMGIPVSAETWAGDCYRK